MTARAGKRLTVADVSPQEFYFLHQKPSASVSIATGAVHTVSNWTEVSGSTDPEGWCDGTNITFPRAGFVIVQVSFRWELNGTGARSLIYETTSSARLGTVNVQPFRETGECLTYMNTVEAGEAHRVKAQQQSGGNLTLFASEQTQWRVLFFGEGQAA